VAWIVSGIVSRDTNTYSLINQLLTGLLVITASFCYAELGAMMPSTGGDFDYLKRAYGDSTAFAFAWFYFWISKTGSLAIISTVFGNYIVNLFNGLNNDDDGDASDDMTAKGIAVGLIIILTGLNFLGVKESSGVVNFLTVLKIGLVVTVCLVGVYYVSKHQDILT
jgi:basic amino acid/polyamine antiporter, APA family